MSPLSPAGTVPTGACRAAHRETESPARLCMRGHHKHGTCRPGARLCGIATQRPGTRRCRRVSPDVRPSGQPAADPTGTRLHGGAAGAALLTRWEVAEVVLRLRPGFPGL